MDSSEDGLVKPAPAVPVSETEVLTHARRLSGNASLNAPSVLDRAAIPSTEVRAHARRMSANDALAASSDGASSTAAAAPVPVSALSEEAPEGLVSIARSPRADGMANVAVETTASTTECV